ncbi:MAG: adenylyltransferase/cytidyltransferase family protein [bacterium]|nr:MAG: adenylyltransferase/cytidyltransferase family protein [bacterium]
MTKNIVLIGGCFDILHIGHIKFLKKSKSFGNYLVVLLEPDENIKKTKGDKRPIFKLKERKETLESLKFVNKVVIVPKYANHETYDRLVSKIKPNIIAITEDDPIKDKKSIQAKSVGAKLKIVKKYKSLSSTKISNFLGF